MQICNRYFHEAVVAFHCMTHTDHDSIFSYSLLEENDLCLDIRHDIIAGTEFCVCFITVDPHSLLVIDAYGVLLKGIMCCREDICRFVTFARIVVVYSWLSN